MKSPPSGTLNRSGLPRWLWVMLLCLTLPTPLARGFVTVLSGDEGAVNGLINRQFEEWDTYVSVYEDESYTPSGWRAFEFYRYMALTREAVSLVHTNSELRLEVKTHVDSNDRIAYRDTGRTWDHVPTQQELNAVALSHYDTTLSDGTQLQVPTDIVVHRGDPATRAAPSFILEFTETVEFELSDGGRLGEENAFIECILRRIDPLPSQSAVIARQWVEWSSDRYFSSSVSIEDVTIIERSDGDYNLYQQQRADALETSRLIDSFVDGRFKGRLDPGVYELQLRSRWGGDGYSYPTDASMTFAARPIPEPSSLASLALMAVFSRLRSRPGGR